MPTRPLVTVMIATRDRAPELRRTLELLREQAYYPLEIVIVDDGSIDPVESLVRELWPRAIVIRHEESRAQCQRRNECFAASHGEFILQLDDDCCFTRSHDLDAAVEYLIQRPAAGAVVFDLFNGPVIPETLKPSSASPGCVASFVGAAILFRADAVRQTAGYRPFFQSHREEEELALQLLGKGWPILFCPWILSHHRLSALNRNNVVSWQRGLRNDIWILMLHMPLRRLPIEVGWKLSIGAWDALRLARFGALCYAILNCLLGLRKVWPLRHPLPLLALRRYDALRVRRVLSETEFAKPPGITFRDLCGWFVRWRNRARDASAWEAETSGKGESHIARYAHEFGPPVSEEIVRPRR